MCRRLFASVAVAIAVVVPTSAEAATTCAPPTGPQEFQRAAPEALGLDAAKLRSATRFMASRSALSVRVYRHGCLASRSHLDPYTEHVRNNVWSVTKGVTALLTGRAITQGKLGLDDPIARYLPEADAAHGAITVRQLLTQTSGLRFSWSSDVLARDAVGYTLALPFKHRPGTYFEYAQTTVTLLGAVVQRAVGEDLQAYAHRELFAPLGIPRHHWTWTRDATGQTQAYAFLFMPPKHLGRVGQLLLSEGRWGPQQLINRAYMRELAAPTPTNGGYGFLTWTNAGGWLITATAPDRRRIDAPFIPTAPPDAYAFVGFLGQLVLVIPSLDMVIVRTGLPPSSGQTSDIDYEGIRRILQAVTDVDVPDPGPYTPMRGSGSFSLASWLDLETLQLAVRR